MSEKENKSPPPPPPPPPRSTVRHCPSSPVVSPPSVLAFSSLAAPSGPASSLNPHARPFFSGGASSSRLPSGDLPDWLLYSSPSSSSSPEPDGSPPHEVTRKGKASVDARQSLKDVSWSWPRSSFMEAVCHPLAFMAGGARVRSDRGDGHRAPAGQLWPGSVEAGKRTPVLVPESRKVSIPDPNGWQLVIRKRKQKSSVKKARSRSRARKVPADLIGLCFNCVCDDHVSRNCPYPSYYLRCREPGHLVGFRIKTSNQGIQVWCCLNCSFLICIALSIYSPNYMRIYL
jgi:hypothetical protein